MGMDQADRGGSTAPEIIHTLLRHLPGSMPHSHLFSCLKRDFLDAKVALGKLGPPDIHTGFAARSSWDAPQSLFICNQCFLVFNFTQRASPYAVEKLELGHPVPCQGARAHHFHWHSDPWSDVNDAIGIPLDFGHSRDDAAFQITCCKCEYGVMVAVRSLPLSTSALAKLNDLCPTEEKYCRALKLVLTILTTALQDAPKSIKLNGTSFVATFGESESSVDFFEGLGYRRDEGVLVPNSEILTRNHLTLCWLAFTLELYNKLLSMGLLEEAQSSIFTSGEGSLLKMFGGTSQDKKFRRYGEVDPFSLPAEELTSCYFKLGCVRDMADEIIWEVFRTLVMEKPQLAPTYFDHVISIAEERQSSFLLNEIALAKSQGEYSASDLERARKHFGIPDPDAPMDEFSVLDRFQQLRREAPGDLGEHQTNLKLLSQVYPAPAIGSFLQTGRMPSKPDGKALGPNRVLRGNSVANVARPVGLDNIGNTCYLNSLLQYYFSIRYLREQVLGFQLDASEFDSSPELEGELTIDSRKVSRRELALARYFVKHLKHLFGQLATEEVREYIAPSLELAKMSLGNMDVSLLPASPQANLEEPSALQASPPMETPSAECTPSPNLDSRRSLSPALPSPQSDRLSPMLAPDLIELRSRSSSVDMSGNDLAFGMQQDVSGKPIEPLTPAECMDHIMWQLEKAFASQPPGTEANGAGAPRKGNLIKELFYGETRQELSYVKQAEDVRSTKTEAFSHLIFNVSKPTDIYAGFDGYFGSQKVELDGNEAIRELVITKAPPILQIQLQVTSTHPLTSQRVQFDRQRLRVYKSNEFFRFYDRIFLDRYMDGALTNPDSVARLSALAHESAALRQAMGKEAYLAGIDANHKQIVATPQIQLLKDLVSSYQRRLQALELQPDPAPGHRFDAGPTDAIKLRHAIEMISATILELKQEQEGKQLRAKLTLDALVRFRALSEELEAVNAKHLRVEYRLHAVFIHKGSANYGHYWVYIRDWVHDAWYKFNDEHVVAVPRGEVYADTSGSSANPYYIIYLCADRKPAPIGRSPLGIPQLVEASRPKALAA
ncbi:ubiquitin-specific protease ubp2 [Massospora cicadina]|nr:ubiquitin-specific protease ubp2 [Massospora cicadina]